MIEKKLNERVKLDETLHFVQKTTYFSIFFFSFFWAISFAITFYFRDLHVAYFSSLWIYILFYDSVSILH